MPILVKNDNGDVLEVTASRVLTLDNIDSEIAKCQAELTKWQDLRAQFMEAKAEETLVVEEPAPTPEPQPEPAPEQPAPVVESPAPEPTPETPVEEPVAEPAPVNTDAPVEPAPVQEETPAEPVQPAAPEQPETITVQ